MKTINYLLFLFLLCSYSAAAQFGGTSLEFANGVDDRVEMPDGSYLDIGTAISIEAWILPTGQPNNEDGKIFSKISDNVNDNSVILGAKFGSIYFEVHLDGNLVDLTAGEIVANQWTHVMATYSVGGKARIYINGILEGETDAMSGDHGYTTNPGYIGWMECCNGAILEFKGQIDEFRFWQTELNPNTIRTWMHRHVDESHPDFDELTAYLKLDEGSGDAAANEVAGNSWGVIQNSPSWTSSASPFAGSHQFFPSGALNQLTGIWNGQPSGSSGDLSIEGIDIGNDEALLFANNNTGYLLVGNVPDDVTLRLNQVWYAYPLGEFFSDVIFDATNSGLNLSNFDKVHFLFSDSEDFSDAQVIDCTVLENSAFTNGTFNIPEYFTVGFSVQSTPVNNPLSANLDLSISPNPSNGIFQIQIQEELGADITFDVSDSNGRNILKETYNHQPGNSFTKSLDLSEAPQGVYFLRIISGNKVGTRQLLVLK